MSQSWLGVVVAGDHVTAVRAAVPAAGPVTIVADETIKLQKGDRSEGYALIHKRFSDLVSENPVEKVVIKASASSQGRSSIAHLHAAELRGVIMASGRQHAQVVMRAKAHISRNFGERRADDYLSDDAFWNAEVDGSLKVGSREAALLILAERQDS